MPLEQNFQKLLPQFPAITQPLIRRLWKTCDKKSRLLQHLTSLNTYLEKRVELVRVRSGWLDEDHKEMAELWTEDIQKKEEEIKTLLQEISPALPINLFINHGN